MADSNRIETCAERQGRKISLNL